MIGRGGMAVVYLAEHRILGNEVALKVLHARYNKQQTMVHRFVNEARTMASIRHSSIVAIHDIGRSRECDLYTVMELLRGETLGQRIERVGRLSEARTIKIARQIAAALAAAHERGAIHRDIKPNNIFLIADSEVPGGERVKVLDFGIAKRKGMGGGELTAVGVVIGTPAYMAPEQCTPNTEVDGRSDIYSLGALMYRMVTGERPFATGDEYELMWNHLHATPDTPIERGASISMALNRAIMTCLAKDPAVRFQSMHELSEHLAVVEADAVEISGPIVPPQTMQRLPLPAPPPRPEGIMVDPGSPAQASLEAYDCGCTEVEIRVADMAEQAATVPSRRAHLIWSTVGGLVLAGAIIVLSTLLG
ncbi:MAG: serine/threonine protein kinase [Proteobacteria bacterium]|nr:serine/threonine protein kinase [Pseudomonadota bacterium]